LARDPLLLGADAVEAIAALHQLRVDVCRAMMKDMKHSECARQRG